MVIGRLLLIWRTKFLMRVNKKRSKVKCHMYLQYRSHHFDKVQRKKKKTEKGSVSICATDLYWICRLPRTRHIPYRTNNGYGMLWYTPIYFLVKFECWWENILVNMVRLKKACVQNNNIASEISILLNYVLQTFATC